MTSTYLSASTPLLSTLLHGTGLGGLAAAAVLTRARLHHWNVSEPWAITAAWSLLGAGVAAALLVVRLLT